MKGVTDFNKTFCKINLGGEKEQYDLIKVIKDKRRSTELIVAKIDIEDKRRSTELIEAKIDFYNKDNPLNKEHRVRTKREIISGKGINSNKIANGYEDNHKILSEIINTFNKKKMNNMNYKNSSIEKQRLKSMNDIDFASTSMISKVKFNNENIISPFDYKIIPNPELKINKVRFIDNINSNTSKNNNNNNTKIPLYSEFFPNKTFFNQNFKINNKKGEKGMSSVFHSKNSSITSTLPQSQICSNGNQFRSSSMIRVNLKPFTNGYITNCNSNNLSTININENSILNNLLKDGLNQANDFKKQLKLEKILTQSVDFKKIIKKSLKEQKTKFQKQEEKKHKRVLKEFKNYKKKNLEETLNLRGVKGRSHKKRFEACVNVREDVLYQNRQSVLGQFDLDFQPEDYLYFRRKENKIKENIFSKIEKNQLKMAKISIDNIKMKNQMNNRISNVTNK